MPGQNDIQARSFLSHADVAALPEVKIRHPFNPNSDVRLKRLSPIFGLERLALYIACVPPGKESFLYHRHEHDEEFLLIISGRGQAEIANEIIHVGPGDIMAFPAPDGPAHHLTNPYDEELVYFMGGESSGFDIGYFPRIGRKLIFAQSKIWSIDDADAEQLTFDHWLAT